MDPISPIHSRKSFLFQNETDRKNHIPQKFPRPNGWKFWLLVGLMDLDKTDEDSNSSNLSFQKLGRSSLLL